MAVQKISVQEVTVQEVSFTSVEFEDYLKALSIRHGLAALNSPHANADVERFNRVVKD